MQRTALCAAAEPSRSAYQSGKLVLNRNPINYFAEVGQAAFCPENVVPGTAISPDKMLRVRVFSYHDAHIHRLGPNYHLIPVNAPKNALENSYQRSLVCCVPARGSQGNPPG